MYTLHACGGVFKGFRISGSEVRNASSIASQAVRREDEATLVPMQTLHKPVNKHKRGTANDI